MSDAIQCMYSAHTAAAVEPISYYVQVISLEEIPLLSLIKNYILTISDGVHCMDCFVVPMLSHLFLMAL
jgi:hypothetical protein